MMAASSKFDLSSSSSDGPAHPSGQRGPHVSASLERPGSFRRTENQGSTSNASRGGPMTSQVDVGNFLQNLLTDLPTTVLDSSLSRNGEVRRSISSIIGVSQEDSLLNARTLPSSSLEEIRRLKNNLLEETVKARDRAKAFGEAALKMNKCSGPSGNMSKKRSRTDISSSERLNAAVPGGSTPKIGSHSHLNGRNLEVGPQKSEERAKSGMPNRKIGTSFHEERIDVRPNKMTRPSATMEKDRDVFKLANSSATPPEEKSRALANAVDGWEKPKTRKKRSSIKSDVSGNAVLSRPHDGDRESSKRGMQQKLTTDTRSRLNNTHGFRPNGIEENYAASPTSTMKMNTSVRGPRSNSGSVSKTSSPCNNRAPENSDDWEHPNSKLNRKRTVSARASSPPQPQWCGPKTKKGTRVGRRSYMPPVVSSRDEYISSDAQNTVAVNDDNLGNMRRPSSNVSLQSKSRSDLVLSDCEDYGAVENKSKEKSKKCSEIEEKTHKVTNLVVPSRKNKVVNEEDQKHGKMGRGTAPLRSGNIVSNEKFDGIVTAKQMRTVGTNFDKTESKPGRSVTKKWSDRKGHTRPRHSDTPSLEFAGESDDDQEELLAAANAALDSVRHACLPPQPPKTQDQRSFSGKGRNKTQSFWGQNEDFFTLLSVEDQDFLNQQIRLSDEVASSVCDSGDCQNLKGGFENNSVPSTPTLSNRNCYDGNSNGTITINEHMRSSQSKHTEPFLEELVLGNVAQVGLPICQVLLSAIIEEEEIESFNHKNNNDDQSYRNAYGLSFGNRSTLYSYKASSGWNFHDELTLENLGSNGTMDDLVPSLTTTSSPPCTDFQYSQMCIDDRILLELNEIGIYPEPVPCLAPSEDEDIDEGINRLMAKLHEQASKKKRMLLGIEKVVKEARESQGRELERIALDKLVGRAYEKYMVCWGPKASGSKNTNRANKQATLAFIRRTLARYQKFEETGTSCFGEPPFKDMLYSVSSHKDVSKIATDSRLFTSERNHGLPSHSNHKDSIRSNYSEVFQSINHSTEQTSGREDHWSDKLKKKELLLDEVVGSATDILRASSSLGNSIKGKRSERDREGKGQNRDSTAKNNAKIGRPSSSNTKGERKNKSKPKQKIVNGLLGNFIEMPNTVSPSSEPKSHENISGNTKKEDTGPVSSFPGVPDIANDNSAIDFSDFGDFGGQGQDIGSWLNIEDDNLQDHDFMGLEIPMDDLSEVMF